MPPARRFRVLPLALDTGEILPTLVHASSWIPVRVATRWVVRRRRWQSMPATISNDLRLIGLLYTRADGSIERDVLQQGSGLTGRCLSSAIGHVAALRTQWG